MAKRRLKATWERGYRSHGYWVGKQRVGVVRLQTGGAAEAKYRWEAGSHTGEAATLRDAKRTVEITVEMGAAQLPLFFEPLSDGATDL